MTISAILVLSLLTLAIWLFLKEFKFGYAEGFNAGKFEGFLYVMKFKEKIILSKPLVMQNNSTVQDCYFIVVSEEQCMNIEGSHNLIKDTVFDLSLKRHKFN